MNDSTKMYIVMYVPFHKVAHINGSGTCRLCIVYVREDNDSDVLVKINMDYMYLPVCHPRKAVKINNSLIDVSVQERSNFSTLALEFHLLSSHL